MDVVVKKQALRQNMRAILGQLSEEYRHNAGKKVSSHIGNELAKLLPTPKATIGLFASLKDEISTKYLDADLKSAGCKRAVAVADGLDLNFLPIMEGSVEDFSWRIASSPNASSLNIDNLDVIFVPGLAFDQQGHRLGRGAGFFDRALAAVKRLNKRPLLVGLSLDEQIVPLVPNEPHDIVMDYLCTPKCGLYKLA